MTVVISRSTWQPRHDNGCAVIGTQEWENAGRELWLHHSLTNPPGPDATLAQDSAHVRDFEQIGENRFGCGISYTWVVMPSGRVFQGHDVDRQGTHTAGRNNRSRAICLAGNYDVNDLPQRMRNAVALLLRELGATLDGGHRDVYATKCPGDYAYAKIGEINSLATSGNPIGEDDVSAADVWNYPVQVVHGDGTTHQANAGDVLRHLELAIKIPTDQLSERVNALAVKVDALTNALSDDEAKILAAIRDLPAGPGGGLSAEQVEAVVRSVFADAGDDADAPTS